MPLTRTLSCLSLSVLMVLAWTVALDAQTPQPVEVLSRTPIRVYPVIKNGTPIEVNAQIVKIAIRHDGKEKFANVLMLREPGSGLHWWTYQGAASKTDSFDFSWSPWLVYFTGDRAVGFAIGLNRSLMAREVVDHGADFATVERAVLADIARNTRALTEGGVLPWFVEVSFADLRSQLGHDFLFIPGRAISPSPTITSVSHADHLWTIRLEGPNQDFADVILDEHFGLKDVRRVPAR